MQSDAAIPSPGRRPSVIVPVIDLMGGVAVRGVGGRRNEYRPVQSVLAADATPRNIARAFLDRLNLDEFYLADLDAIQGNASPAFGVYRELTDEGGRLLIDAGLQTAREAAEFLESANAHDLAIAGVIVGSESLESAADGRAITAMLGRKMIFSLDLRNGTPQTRIEAWKRESPLEIARKVLDWGVRSLIVLDLAQVGMRDGVGRLEICEAARKLDGTIELISGGGVRNAADVRTLLSTGCDRVLVASALHQGAIGRDEISQLNLEIGNDYSVERPACDTTGGA